MRHQFTPSSDKVAERFYALAPGLQFIVIFLAVMLESRAGWLFGLLAAAGLALAGWLQALRRRRLIGDTPTSRIASAAQGYVELRGSGHPFPGQPVLSPSNGLPCLWYRYLHEEKDHDGKWQIVERGESDVSFILDDGSGQCLVDPDGAEIIPHRCEQSLRKGHRITEWKFVERDTLYAIGDFRTFGGHHLELDPRADLKELLSEWKKDPAELRQRFDRNGDGEVDQHEWELARAAARAEVADRHGESRRHADSHVMKQPEDGRCYLISGYDPDRLARRYAWWSTFHLLVFLAALGAIPWAWWRFA